MTNITQKQWVKEILLKDKRISRNTCLRNYISRLGAIICDLEKEGYSFNAKYIKVDTPWGKGKGKDYLYTIIESSYSKLVQEFIDKEKIKDV